MPLVSGTYAKYVTQADGNAKARVAKWGVEIVLEKDRMFGDEYYGKENSFDKDLVVLTSNDETPNVITVKASKEEEVVAPGTRGYITFDLKGKPEVATALKIDPKFNFTGDWEVLGKKYYPLNFAFGIEVYASVHSGSGVGETKTIYLKVEEESSRIKTEFQSKPFYFTHQEIMDVINFLNIETAKIEPNKDISKVLYDVFEEFSDSNGDNVVSEWTEPTGKYIFEWIWPYERGDKDAYAKWDEMETAVISSDVLGSNPSIKDIYDYADTVLGDKTVLPEIKIDYSISITQID